MLSVVDTPNTEDPTSRQEVDAPRPEPDEALVRVHAFSVNRGELSLLARRDDGWRPGQDLRVVVVRPDTDGPSGYRISTRRISSRHPQSFPQPRWLPFQ
ncbi:NADPH:quinone reductase-like Zn-dependent oxidoreductase [Rhodococcus sp. 27YEA15]